MTRRFVTRVVTACFAAGLVAAALSGEARAAAATPDYAQERAERATGLTRPYGWFSLVALQWLKPGMTTVGSAKGNDVVLPGIQPELVSFEQRDGRVTVHAAAASLIYRGQPVARGLTVGDDESDEAALGSGSVRMWAIDRGGKRYLRVKDADAPARVHFRGLRWYAPDQHFRVEARWVPYAGRHTLRFLNQLGQVSDVDEPGYAEFTMDGKRVVLTPLSATGQQLWFVFRDETYRIDTDGGGRFLYAEAPSNGVNKPGTVVLDFNEAVNPPCAYSPFATCPLAAMENRMPVAVRAGEKRYGE